jgi:hypothetical protein
MNCSVNKVFQIEHFPNMNKIWKKIDLNVFQRKNKNKKDKEKKLQNEDLISTDPNGTWPRVKQAFVPRRAGYKASQ